MLYTKYNKDYTFFYIVVHIILGVILSIKNVPLSYNSFTCNYICVSIRTIGLKQAIFYVDE